MIFIIIYTAPQQLRLFPHQFHWTHKFIPFWVSIYVALSTGFNWFFSLHLNILFLICVPSSQKSEKFLSAFFFLVFCFYFGFFFFFSWVFLGFQTNNKSSNYTNEMCYFFFFIYFIIFISKIKNRTSEDSKSVWKLEKSWE